MTVRMSSAQMAVIKWVLCVCILIRCVFERIYTGLLLAANGFNFLGLVAIPEMFLRDGSDNPVRL